jgi:hypothetical protein
MQNQTTTSNESSVHDLDSVSQYADGQPHDLNIGELGEIFDFDEADLFANRQLRYSARQHRLRGAAIGLLMVAALAVISIPAQVAIGNVLGWVAAPCFAVVGVIGILAAVGGIASVWNTIREGVVTPVQRYQGQVAIQKRGGQFYLESEAFSIGVEPDAADRFIAGEYIAYYVPNYVADRTKLFSIEKTMG